MATDFSNVDRGEPKGFLSTDFADKKICQICEIFVYFLAYCSDAIGKPTPALVRAKASRIALLCQGLLLLCLSACVTVSQPALPTLAPTAVPLATATTATTTCACVYAACLASYDRPPKFMRRINKLKSECADVPWRLGVADSVSAAGPIVYSHHKTPQ